MNEVRAKNKIEREQFFIPLPGGSLHNSLFRRLDPEAHSRDQIGSHIDRQHTHDRHGEGYVRKLDPKDVGVHFLWVAVQDVRGKTFDVIEYTSTFFNGGNDGTEVVVGQNHVGRFLGDIVAA